MNVSAETLRAVVAAAGERLVIAGDILQHDEFFLADDQLSMDEEAFRKRVVEPSDAGNLLEGFAGILASLEPFEAAGIEAAFKDYCEAQHIKPGSIIHALRLALTGKSSGVGLFETIAILGQERSIHRIGLAIRRRDQLLNGHR